MAKVKLVEKPYKIKQGAHWFVDTQFYHAPFEKKVIDVFVECETPRTTRQSSQIIMVNKKTGKSFVGVSKKGRSVEKMFKWLFSQHIPKETLSGAIAVDVVWIYPSLKALPAWKSRAIEAMRDKHKLPTIMLACHTRPDCENIVKAFDDVLTDMGFWVDDALECKLQFIKCYAQPNQKSGIWLKVYELPELKRVPELQETIDEEPPF